MIVQLYDRNKSFQKCHFKQHWFPWSTFQDALFSFQESPKCSRFVIYIYIFRFNKKILEIFENIETIHARIYSMNIYIYIYRKLCITVIIRCWHNKHWGKIIYKLRSVNAHFPEIGSFPAIVWSNSVWIKIGHKFPCLIKLKCIE